jgi:hypothetical protein
MKATEPEAAEGRPFSLSREELMLLRFTCDLSAQEESPLGPVDAIDEPELLDQAAKTLAARHLIDLKSYRPDRELLRRLLIVSEPDARIVMLRYGSDRRHREIDAYERASALVSYRREGERHELGPPRDLDSVLKDILAFFKPRRSRGDFVDLSLDPSEYLAFSILAANLARSSGTPLPDRAPTPPTEEIDAGLIDRETTAKNLGQTPRGPEVPIRESKRRSGGQPEDSTTAAERPSALIDESEGTPIQGMLRRITTTEAVAVAPAADPMPSREEWDSAISKLVKKGLVQRSGESQALRPFLHDLARGLASRHRSVLTRFDFGEEDWFVRDATFVAVPGSLFHLLAEKETIRVRELDARGLEELVKETIGPVEP